MSSSSSSHRLLPPVQPSTAAATARPTSVSQLASPTSSILTATQMRLTLAAIGGTHQHLPPAQELYRAPSNRRYAQLISPRDSASPNPQRRTPIEDDSLDAFCDGGAHTPKTRAIALSVSRKRSASTSLLDDLPPLPSGALTNPSSPRQISSPAVPSPLVRRKLRHVDSASPSQATCLTPIAAEWKLSPQLTPRRSSTPFSTIFSPDTSQAVLPPAQLHFAPHIPSALNFEKSGRPVLKMRSAVGSSSLALNPLLPQLALKAPAQPININSHLLPVSPFTPISDDVDVSMVEEPRAQASLAPSTASASPAASASSTAVVNRVKSGPFNTTFHDDAYRPGSNPVLWKIASYLSLEDFCNFTKLTTATAKLWKCALLMKQLFERYPLGQLLNSRLSISKEDYTIYRTPSAWLTAAATQTSAIEVLDASGCVNPNFRTYKKLMQLPNLIRLIKASIRLRILNLNSTTLAKREGVAADQPRLFQTLLAALDRSPQGEKAVYLTELHLADTDIGDDELTLLANSTSAKGIVLLDLSRCKKITSKGIKALAASTYLKLTTLYLPETANMQKDAMQALFYSPVTANLHTLAFEDGDDLKCDIWIELIAESPTLNTLEKLYLNNSRHLSHRTLKQLQTAPKFQKLTLLHISHAPLIEAVDLYTLFNSGNISRITDLALTDLVRVEMRLNAEPFKNLPHLQRLKLQLDLSGDDTALLTWIANLDSLVHLDLSHNRRFEDTGLEKLLLHATARFKKVTPGKSNPLRSLNLSATSISNVGLILLSRPVLNPIRSAQPPYQVMFPNLESLSLDANEDITLNGILKLLESPKSEGFKPLHLPHEKLQSIDIGISYTNCYNPQTDRWHLDILDPKWSDAGPAELAHLSNVERENRKKAYKKFLNLIQCQSLVDNPIK